MKTYLDVDMKVDIFAHIGSNNELILNLYDLMTKKFTEVC
jgi:hypothetical protein